jgi:hypothetical protein
VGNVLKTEYVVVYSVGGLTVLYISVLAIRYWLQKRSTKNKPLTDPSEHWKPGFDYDVIKNPGSRSYWYVYLNISLLQEPAEVMGAVKVELHRIIHKEKLASNHFYHSPDNSGPNHLETNHSTAPLFSRSSSGLPAFTSRPLAAKIHSGFQKTP